MNKVELLRRLNSINSEINDIYRREMLQESFASGFKLFFKSGGSFFKNVGGVLKGMIGKAPEAIKDAKNMAKVNKNIVKIGLGTPQYLEQCGKEASLLSKTVYGWYTAMATAWFGTGTAVGGTAYAYNKLKGGPENIPSKEEVQTIAAATSNINNEGLSPEQEKNLGILGRLWDSIQTQYEKFKLNVEGALNSIGENVMSPTAFIMSSLILSLLLMLAGAVIYYINVGGNISSSIQAAFSDAIDKVKNSNGAVQTVLNICMAPANIVLKFISQSPIGSIIFGLGACVFMATAIIAFVGQSALSGDNSAQGDSEGEASAPAETPAYISNIW